MIQDEDQITLRLLENIDNKPMASQRDMAVDMGVALGLINAYVKRCVKKGLLKVRSAPTQRFAYYLTPQGFAEKSRLASIYLSHSFSLFRNARRDIAIDFGNCQERGWGRVLLAGDGDVAEIATICSMETEIRIAGILTAESLRGMRGQTGKNLDAFGADAVLLAALDDAQEFYDACVNHFGAERVLVPAFLRSALVRMAGKVPVYHD